MAEAFQRVLTKPWSNGGKSGFYKISLGTLNALGIPLTGQEISETTFDVGSKAISRSLWPGGPTVNYTRPSQTITRMVGGNVSTAKGRKLVVLEAGDSRDTIHYSGDTRHFVKHLLSVAGASSMTVEIKGPKGTTYGVIPANAGA